jgi:hypothetical protein
MGGTHLNAHHLNLNVLANSAYPSHIVKWRMEMQPVYVITLALSTLTVIKYVLAQMENKCAIVQENVSVPITEQEMTVCCVLKTVEKMHIVLKSLALLKRYASVQGLVNIPNAPRSSAIPIVSLIKYVFSRMESINVCVRIWGMKNVLHNLHALIAKKMGNVFKLIKDHNVFVFQIPVIGQIVMVLVIKSGVLKKEHAS